MPEPAAISAAELAAMIDHTLLKPEATAAEVDRLCAEARQYGFATVCVHGAFVPQAATALAGAHSVPIAVVGFPLGAATSASKAWEAAEAVSLGAREIDMVVRVGALKSGDQATVERDIATVVRAVAPRPVKVILETALLSPEEIVIGCRLAQQAGAAFVKTSTGFGPGGATTQAVQLMRRTVGAALGVKASGGIRTRADAERMIAAGANRLGCSASVAIVTGAAGTGNY